MTANLPDPAGPIFISYRWLDGADQAIDAARRLRASGVPVWLDRDDLPPGETQERLREALAGGISGALFVATPNVGVRRPHDAVLDLEAPTILDNLASHSDFTVAILNTATLESGKVDRDAPARWYGRADASRYKQYSVVDGSLDRMGGELAIRRLHLLRMRRGNGPLTIDLQTRVIAASLPNAADLVFRTIPPVTGRIPTGVVWEDLKRFVAWVPNAVAEERAPAVLLLGGAHLTVACAVGASLAQPSGVPLVVRATDGDLWHLTRDNISRRSRLPLIGTAPRVRRLRWRGEGSALAVLIDLVPTRAAPTFMEHLVEHSDTFARGVTIASSRALDATSGPLAVKCVVDQLRTIAAAQTGEVHVFLRTPWVAAALMGALMNTLRVTLYEWDNSVAKPRYEKTITVAPGVAGGAVTEVHLP